jgi:hypothetical protein
MLKRQEEWDMYLTRKQERIEDQLNEFVEKEYNRVIDEFDQNGEAMLYKRTVNESTRKVTFEEHYYHVDELVKEHYEPEFNELLIKAAIDSDYSDHELRTDLKRMINRSIETNLGDAKEYQVLGRVS